MGPDFEVVEASDSPYPVVIDRDGRRVTINPASRVLPRSTQSREIALRVATAFELAIETPNDELRSSFYTRLNELLRLEPNHETNSGRD
jgi:hypothetical protein